VTELERVTNSRASLPLKNLSHPPFTGTSSQSLQNIQIIVRTVCQAKLSHPPSLVHTPVLFSLKSTPGHFRFLFLSLRVVGGVLLVF